MPYRNAEVNPSLYFPKLFKDGFLVQPKVRATLLTKQADKSMSSHSTMIKNEEKVLRRIMNWRKLPGKYVKASILSAVCGETKRALEWSIF